MLDWEEQTQQKISSNNSNNNNNNNINYSFSTNNTNRQQNNLNKENSTSAINTTTTASDNTTNPLRKFTQYCEHSKNLLHIFRIDIYRPLCDFFSEEDDLSDSDVIREVPKSLEKIVQKWEALLHFSPINEKLFNTTSTATTTSYRDNKLINTSLRTYQHQQRSFTTTTDNTDLVLRLVPDIYQKKLEVLRLANKWRLVSKAKVIQRRGTYTLSPTTLTRRETAMPRRRVSGVSQELLNNDYDVIQGELKRTRTRYDESSRELRAAQEKCLRYETEMEFCRTECANLRDQLKQTAELRKAIEMRVCDSYSSSGLTVTYTEENENDRGETNNVLLQQKQQNQQMMVQQSRDLAQWEKELERVKAKFSRQKVKFLNARKQIEALNKQLEISHDRCSRLHTKIEHDAQSCRTLEKQLDLARKNIQTQGNMVDALQSQCYTLKRELDTSNVKKGELYTQLNTTLEHCKNVEHDLKQTRLKYKDLVDENGRRRSREDDLERENQQLRKFIESSGLRRRSMEANTLPVNSESNNNNNNASTWKFQSQIIKEIKHQPHSPNNHNKQSDCLFPDIKSARSF